MSPEEILAAWLQTTLGDSYNSWHLRPLQPLINSEGIRKIHECFHLLSVHAKMKVLMSLTCIPNRMGWKKEMQGLFDTACVDQDYCVTVFAQLLKKYPSTGCLDIFVDAADPVTTKAILVGMKTELTRLLASKTDLCCVPFEYLTFKRPNELMCLRSGSRIGPPSFGRNDNWQHEKTDYINVIVAIGCNIAEGILNNQNQLEVEGKMVGSANRGLALAMADANATSFSASTSGASTSGASTSGASTPGALTPGALTPGALTPGASTPGASTPGASSSGASSSGASSSGASSLGASSSGASSSGASSSGASSSGASSSGASTSGASTSGASTSGASTSGASTSGASTSGASTSGASTSGASTLRAPTLRATTIRQRSSIGKRKLKNLGRYAEWLKQKPKFTKILNGVGEWFLEETFHKQKRMNDRGLMVGKTNRDLVLATLHPNSSRTPTIRRIPTCTITSGAIASDVTSSGATASDATSSGAISSAASGSTDSDNNILAKRLSPDEA